MQDSQASEEMDDTIENISSDEVSNTNNNVSSISLSDINKEDWGFAPDVDDSNIAVVDSDTALQPVGNDNTDDQDWEWAYVEDTPAQDYPMFEAIGDNSYICSSDLYYQEKVSDHNPILYSANNIKMKQIPQIFDSSEETDFIDPYQNSILKD